VAGGPRGGRQEHRGARIGLGSELVARYGIKKLRKLQITLVIEGRTGFSRQAAEEARRVRQLHPEHRRSGKAETIGFWLYSYLCLLHSEDRYKTCSMMPIVSSPLGYRTTDSESVYRRTRDFSEKRALRPCTTCPLAHQSLNCLLKACKVRWFIPSVHIPLESWRQSMANRDMRS